MKKSVDVETVAKPLTENAASEVMWLYYRDNKTQLVSHVGEYRDFIHAQIAAGVPAELEFARFLRPPEPIPPTRRASP